MTTAAPDARGASRERCASACRSPMAAAGDDASVLGPASLFRLRGRERQVLVVKAAERRRAPCTRSGRPCGAWPAAREHAGVSFSVDVDPQ